MEPSEENMKTLMNMGFVDVTAIKRALRLAKNDVNEAVAILTNEQPGSSYDTLDEVEMKELGKGNKSEDGKSAPDPPPPSYDEAVEPVEDEEPSSTSTETKEDENQEASKEFPTTNLYELESRVFTDQWSIPYKKEESLGKCLVASTRLAEEGLMDADENCMRFVSRCMPEAFKKLMTSNAVHRWGGDIQEGIYNMLQLLVDLVAARLKHQPVPCDLLGVLSMAFNPDTEFHYKNRSKQWERLHWEEVFGVNQTFAVSPPFNQYKEPCGWLVNLINRFAQQGGFEEIKKHVLDSSDDLDPSTMAALLQPLGICAEYLNALRFSTFLGLAEKKTLKYVTEIADNELKQKKAGSISDLLCTMKTLCLLFWVDDVQEVDDLRLHIALRMLKAPHFNAKMNSLKEITKLIEDSTSSRTNRNAIPEEKILEWLVENKVLSIALEGSIDQSQYCDKLKGIVEFLGTKLSLDELTKIWKMQNDQPLTVVDNIHSIMASAAVKFNNEQLEHLFMLIQKAWKGENDRIQEKLLSLIGRIGRDARNTKTTCKVLELLWDLAHLPGIPTPHLEHALEEHLAILSDSFAVSQQVKSKYVLKCVEDIKKGQTVVPALRQLHHIVKGITKQSYSKHDKGLPQELNRNHEIIKLVTQSLLKCHKMAVNAAEDGHLNAKTIVDGRCGYTHSEHVEVHLRFLAFILQEGALYLQWHRAREIWDCLVANSEAHESDKETCFEWFRKGLSDLEADTQLQLFREKLLKLEPATLSSTGFECVKAFFDSININNHSLKKGPAGLIVDKLDLFGLEFMWQIALETPNEDIANSAVKQLMRVSYSNLSQRLKKDPVALHKRFIDQCYKRLELATITMGGSTIAYGVSHATRLLTATTVPEVASVPSPSRAAKLLVIERLLQLAETYVTTVEDQYTNPRTILPHGASFQGPPITMHVTCDSPKNEFVIVGHANETLQSLRQKIAQKMKTSADNVQIAANDRMLLSSKDQKLLRQLDFEEEQLLTVKTLGVSGAVSRIDESVSALGSRQSYTSEQERLLPGVVMATGGQVFEKLYQLAELEESKITERVRNLLMLIPTDPSVQEALDSICKKETADDDHNSLGGDNSPQESSKAVLEGLFRSNAHSMSAFRVLYNLEVLSSRLMPSMQEDISTQTSAQNFRESFLNAGGLSLVVNVLQRESMPADVDEEIMRGCYSISLQLGRFLLCGQTTTAVMESDLSLTGSLGDTSADSSSLNLSSSFGTSPRKMSLVERMSSVEASGDLAFREGTSVAITVIQTMSTTSFTSMIACLMRMAWASAAGRLRLASSAQPIRDSPGNIGIVGLGRRSRHSSAGSSASTSSENEIQALQAWVCLLANKVSNKDAMIAREALELLVACLQLRHQNLASFYNLTGVSEFIIDILLGCPHHEIRNAALEQFYTLSITDGISDNIRTLHPRQFLLQVLLKMPVPLWTSSCFVRGASQKVLGQCTQYFELRCRLLDSLTLKDQKLLQVRPASMLEDEIDWLNNFEPSDTEESSLWVTDNLVMAGHLQLAKTLLTCEGMDKTKIGGKFINKLLNEYLFPASKLILESTTNNVKVDPQADYNPKIAGIESRVAAFDLLVVLAENCPENLKQISSLLINMHHQPDPAIAKEWEYLPPVDGRSPGKYVGLRNGGATCYMNSVIQQLYHTPGIREGMLGAKVCDTAQDSVFYQIQTVFGHLMESKLQYYEPEQFWRVFKLWGQPVNIREQQDAFEFFTNLTDQLDEHLKNNKQKEVFKPKFRGVFSDQKICQDCPHRYEREEEFFALNLTVKSQNLESSLEQFVRGEMLEGDNAYFCEKCEEKRNTIKRMCIKTLPSVLVIQLKRFGYDWEAGRALKFDDYFKFPWVLDMEPYTVKGMASREEAQQADDNEHSNGTKRNTSVQSCSDELYQLVGIVVHSGQANAGHYYSFIRDRWGTSMNNPTKGRWFRFNDTVVEEFEMSDAALEAECFGGSYKPKIYDSGSSYSSETRLRYWSGYMLFYEKLEGSRTPDPLFHGPISRGVNLPLLKQDSEGEIHVVDSGQCSSPELSPHHEKDRLSELSALVRKGEHRGLFVDKMPPAIQRSIHDENLQFLRYRGIYTNEYFTFIRSLASCNIGYTYHRDYGTMATTSMQVALQFMLNTFFRTKKKLRCEIEEWCMCVERLLKYSRETSLWAVEFLASQQGCSYITPFLLECPTQEIRGAFARIVVNILQSYFHHTNNTDSPHLDKAIEYLLSLLDKEVPDHCRTCGQYFWLLSVYLETDVMCVQHLYRHGAFHRLMTFLIGPIQPDEQDFVSRRWTSLQTREFAYLHVMLASMVIYCDVSPHWSVGRGDSPDRKHTFILPNNDKLLEMPKDMKKILVGTECVKYIRESILAFRELIGGTVPIVDMLLHCSYCNHNFSVATLAQIQEQISTAPVNELKPVFAMLLEMLLMEDPLQRARLKCAVEGNSNDGLLETIRSGTQSDSRRSYQCIKFLVHLSNKCPLAKDYLMSISTRWQWAVNWLKKKMTEYYWTPQSSISNESSTGKSFQRTMSAQDTLAEATALLTELNTQDEEEEDDDEVMEGETTPKMEINGSSEGSEVNGNENNDSSSRRQPVEDDEGVDLEDIDT